MKRFDAGTKVDGGYYFNLAKFEFTHVQPEGGVLEGGAGEQLVRLSFPLVIALAPVLGLTFVMFLPFIGFAMTFGLIAKRTAQAVHGMMVELAGLVQPGWRPGEAYLAGKRPDGAEAKTSDGLDALAAEIDARRKNQ